MWRYAVIYDGEEVVGTFEGEDNHFQELFDLFESKGYIVNEVSRDVFDKEKRKDKRKFYDWI